MIRRATLALAATLALSSLVTAQVPQITVGRNVHVSTARPRAAHDEVIIAADPSNTANLLACSMFSYGEDYQRKQLAVYASSDGGTRWQPVLTDSGGYAADPTCVYGRGGRAYFAGLRAPQAFGGIFQIVASTSGDGGRTWSRSDVALATDIDRPFLAVDLSGGPRDGWVYLVAQAKGIRADDTKMPYGPVLLRSRDAGRSFQWTAQRFSPEGAVAMNPGASPVVLDDGSLVALFEERSGTMGPMPPGPKHPSAPLKVLVSSDGERFDPARTVGQVHGEGTGVVSLSADTTAGPFANRLYAAWSDGRYGDRMQVVLAYSDDRGQTWSVPELVNDNRTPRDTDPSDPVEAIARRPNTSLPMVAVNKDGVVGVLWHDRRDVKPGERGYSVRFAASFDGGETFTPSVLVSERPHRTEKDEEWILGAIVERRGPAGSSVRLQREEWMDGGHTMGLAADANGVFRALWVDNRTGIHQVWTAPITVRGPVVRHGTPELAGLKEISDLVALTFSSPVYDRAANTASVTAQLKNTSKAPIRGPIKLRATMVFSELGTPHALDSDNRVAGDGAVWELAPGSADGVLRPGEQTAARVLKFLITDLVSPPRWLKQHPYPGVLDLQVRVLGRPEGQSQLARDPSP